MSHKLSLRIFKMYPVCFLPVAADGVGFAEAGFVTGAWVPEVQQLCWKEINYVVVIHPWVGKIMETITPI